MPPGANAVKSDRGAKLAPCVESVTIAEIRTFIARFIERKD